MAHIVKEHAIAGREDVSRFMVHLTRDDREDQDGGNTARKNLARIVKEKRISAFNPHCFFNPRLKKLDEKVAAKFAVACFTEVPLNQIHLLCRSISGRQINLEPYGLVFTREFVVSAGGQPALYINGYDNNRWLHECVNGVYDQAVVNGKLIEPYWRILPFINAMHEHYDFTWEREWRVLGGLKFRAKDIVCVILPADKDEDLKEVLAQGGIATISPGWSYERIVAELAKQQRSTRSLNLVQAKKNGN
jgi:hypothetical protein